MKRGDIISVALQGEMGKPRPALVIQSDVFATPTSVIVIPMSSDCVDVPSLRIDVAPTEENGLRQPSQIMVDKTRAVPRDKAGEAFGRVDSATLRRVEVALIALLGLNLA